MSLDNYNDNSISDVADKDDILKFCEFMDCSNIKIDFTSTRENLFGTLITIPTVLLIGAFYLSADLAVLPSYFLILMFAMGIFGYIGLKLIDDHYLIDKSQRVIYRHKKSNYSKNPSRKIFLHFDEIKYLALTGRQSHSDSFNIRRHFHECKVAVITRNNKIVHITDWFETGTITDTVVIDTIHIGPLTLPWSECVIASKELESFKKFAKFLAQVMDTEFIEYPEFGGKLFISGLKPSYKVLRNIFDRIIRPFWVIYLALLVSLMEHFF